MDSVTTDFSENIQYYSEKDEQYLVLFNDLINTIQFFSFAKREVTKKIEISVQGPNAILGIDGAPNNFYIYSQDSIYIHSDTKDIIYLINEQGSILNQFKVNSQTYDTQFPSFELSTYSQLFKSQNRLFLTGAISWFDYAKPPISFIDLANNKHEFYSGKLNAYDEYDLMRVGTRRLFQSSNTIKNHDSMILSFPLEHDLVMIDSDLNISYKELPNPRLGELRIYGQDMRKVNHLSKEYGEFLATVGYYHSVLFDDTHQLLYRIARLPEKIAELRELETRGATRGYRYSILVYDSEYELLGERVIDSSEYDVRMIFCGKDGLYIKKFSNEEDKLIFDIFTLDDL
ncbi:MAG: hypothetical protein Roseis2KO_46790 [Roseivirga sp.]